MGKRETASDIDAAAASWAVRADGDANSPADEAELEAWLGGDMRRIGAYARARAMLIHLDRSKALGPGFDPDSFERDHVSRIGSPNDTNVQTAVPERATRRRFVIGGSMAAAAGVAGMIGISWQAAAQTFATRRGEIRRVPLADGSSMTLNTETVAVVRYTDFERRVDLVAGEALFDVVRNTARPFIVNAGASYVKAASTSFSVRKRTGKAVDVMVREGSVELVQPAVSALPTLVIANMRAVVQTAGSAIATRVVPPAEIDRELAWRQGMLSFEDAPLSQAVAQFARYSDVAIRIGDPSIGSETITGLYAANDPQGFARSAALSLGLKATEEPGAILLSRK